eukprot:SAG31_NODE_4149_length_3529_cov_1.923032_2_plen_160_part_00
MAQRRVYGRPSKRRPYPLRAAVSVRRRAVEDVFGCADDGSAAAAQFVASLRSRRRCIHKSAHCVRLADVCDDLVVLEDAPVSNHSTPTPMLLPCAHKKGQKAWQPSNSQMLLLETQRGDVRAVRVSYRRLVRSVRIVARRSLRYTGRCDARRAWPEAQR